MNKSTEIPFKTLLNRPKLTPNNSGNRMCNEYSYTIKENLIRGLEKTGEYDQYAQIQMHADECNIALILAKAAVDPSVLQQRKGQYLDLTNMPQSLAEFKNLEMKIIREFYDLPVDERNKFDNSVEKYVAEYGSEKWAEALGLNTVEEVKEAIEEVTETPVEAAGEGE